MTRKLMALFVATLLLAGCKGAIKATGDAGPDGAPDVEEEVEIDVPADVTPDVLPDGDPDVVEDPDPDVTTDPVEDPPEDTPADPVADTIGMPCTSDEDCDMGVFCDGPEYCHPEANRQQGLAQALHDGWKIGTPEDTVKRRGKPARPAQQTIPQVRMAPERRGFGLGRGGSVPGEDQKSIHRSHLELPRNREGDGHVDRFAKLGS